MKSALPRDKILRPKLPRNASIKLIGLGGVGSIVARYGAVFLASLKRDATLTLIDGDMFEPSNATRMLFSGCGPKADVVRNELLERFHDSRLTIFSVDEYVTAKNMRRLIGEGDIVLLCVDNHATRKRINDRCRKLKNVVLISGGNDGVGKDSTGRTRRGTYGNAQIYWRRRGKDQTAHLAQFHPEIAHPTDKSPDELDCTELVTSVPQVLFANLAAASAILNTLLLYLANSVHYSELSFDIADGLSRPSIQK